MGSLPPTMGHLAPATVEEGESFPRNVAPVVPTTHTGGCSARYAPLISGSFGLRKDGLGNMLREYCARVNGYTEGGGDWEAKWGGWVSVL